MALVRQPQDLLGLRTVACRRLEPRESPTTAWRPATDLAESADDFILTTDLPGLDLQDLHITVVDNRLTIVGEKKQTSRSPDTHAHHVERPYGTFQRVLNLPADVNTEKIAATYRDGVLTVSVPKAEAIKPRQIEVTVS